MASPALARINGSILTFCSSPFLHPVQRGTFDVVAGKAYHLEVRSTNEKPVGSATPFAARGAIRIGAWKLVDEEAGVEEAVALAKESDGELLISSSPPRSLIRLADQIPLPLSLSCSCHPRGRSQLRLGV